MCDRPADAEQRARWGVKDVVEYVLERGYRRVTLQFPDDMLAEAPAVAGALQQELSACSDAKVYVLADTTYNPLSVDEVAAQHVNADCVIHYGHASLTPVTRTPALCVLPRAATPLDASACTAALAAVLSEHAAGPSGAEAEAGEESTKAAPGGGGSSSGGGSCSGGGGGPGWALVTFDQRYAHELPRLREALAEAYQGPLQVVFADVAPVRLDPPSASSPCPAMVRPAGSGGCGSCAAAGDAGSGCATEPAAAAVGQGAGAAASTSGAGPAGCCRGSEECGTSAAAAAAAAAGPAPSGDEAPSCSSKGGSGGSGGGKANSSAGTGGSGSGGGGTGDGGGGASTSTSYPPPPLGGLVWRPPPGASPGAPPAAILWVGPPSGPALTHLQLTHSGAAWAMVDPEEGCRVARGLADGLERLLRRRYYLVERARGANILGLLVGTLGAAGYLSALEALRALADEAGKKAYTLLVGKPSPAKLANFPEVEVFIMVAEPQGLVLDSSDYLAPIITPHEALLALTGAALEAGAYRLDYGPLLEWAAARASANGGGGRGSGGEAAGAAAAAAASGEGEGSGDEGEGGSGGSSEEGAGGFGGALVPGLQVGGGGGALYGGQGAARRQVGAARSAAEYLVGARSFRGLETPAATGAEIKPAERALPGRSGRAAGYADEGAGGGGGGEGGEGAA